MGSNSVAEDVVAQGMSRRHSFVSNGSSGSRRQGPSLTRRKSTYDQASANGSTGAARKSSAKMSRPPLGAVGERTVRNLRLSRALTLPEGTTVFDACRRMASRRVDAALLTDSNALLCGIITDKDIATRVIAEGLKPEETAVSKAMTRNPVFVMGNTLAVEALQKMVQGRFRHLPVVESGEVIALLDITKCLYDAISGLEKAVEKGNAIAAAVESVERQWGNSISSSTNFIETIREKMFRPSLGSIINEDSKVVIASPTDTVHAATKMMRDLHASSVIIASNKKPRGILTSKDIMIRVVTQNLSPYLTSVEKVMTPNPECVKVDTTILDALHTMHDGKFLHLPVVDQDGYAVACLDVLQLSHVAMALLGNKANGMDTESTVMQKFWDSAFTLDPPEDYDEIRSDASASKRSGSERVKSPLKSPEHEGSFTFKIEDEKGHLHRFSCGWGSLAELISSIRNRIGDEMDANKSYNLLYEDEEGDRVILATDNDLITAVNHAKVAGLKALRLYLDYRHTWPSRGRDSPGGPLSSSSKSRSVDLDIELRNNNQASAYTAVIAGAAAVLGFSMLVYLKRSES